MLSMGLSKPWWEAMKVITGQEKMDASAFREYFKPLEDWLIKKNKELSEPIGWSTGTFTCNQCDGKMRLHRFWDQMVCPASETHYTPLHPVRWNLPLSPSVVPSRPICASPLYWPPLLLPSHTFSEKSNPCPRSIFFFFYWWLCRNCHPKQPWNRLPKFQLNAKCLRKKSCFKKLMEITLLFDYKYKTAL